MLQDELLNAVLKYTDRTPEGVIRYMFEEGILQASAGGLKVGDSVEFRGKDSYFKGQIVALFYKLDGQSIRCVVQDDRGLLLIKDPAQAIKCD